jgi:hypothetical protein
VHHAGGPLRLTATLAAAAAGSVWLSEARLDAAPLPSPAR